MKIVFAPDKFKMCMKASTVSRVLEKAFRTVMPDAELVSVPVSDGGFRSNGPSMIQRPNLPVCASAMISR